MQTFSNMRRDSSNGQIIGTAIFFIVLFFYESLASRFVFLPPLIGVLFYLFRRYDEQDDFWRFCLVLVAISVVGVFNDFALWFLPLLFAILAFIFSFIFENLAEGKVLRIMQVAGAYIGFFGFDSQITPLILVLYCAIESVLVGVYEYTI